MLTVVFGLLATAAVAWPVSRAAHRLRSLFPAVVDERRWPGAPGFGALTCAAGLAGTYCSGPGVGLAVVLAAATARSRWRARREQRDAMAGTDGLARALRALVAELRAGAHPALAARGAAAEAEPQAARVLTAIAVTAQLGGDVGRTLTAQAGRQEHAGVALAPESPSMRPALRQLGNAWALVTRYGLPLAEVLGAVCADLEHRARFARQVAARLAGPRSAASVLTGLPVLGVLLGEAMGAHPVRVLTSTAAGQVLVLLGTALACAGVRWCAWLTERTVLR